MHSVEAVVIHSAVEWLSHLVNILKTIPPALCKVDCIQCFAGGMHFGGKAFTCCITGERTSSGQHCWTIFVPPASTRKVAWDIACCGG